MGHGLRDLDHGRENTGSVQGLEGFPEELQKVFVTALNITPKDHILALASFQKWVDSSISKTNNFPADATVDDMRESYIMGHKIGCKGLTVFRDTSIKEQVLVAGKNSKLEAKETATQVQQKAEAPQPISDVTGRAEDVESGDLMTQTTGKAQHKICPECGGATQMQEGCVSCKGCGWALCK